MRLGLVELGVDTMADQPDQASNPGGDSPKFELAGLAIVVMGVSGAGKSTVGELLGKCLHCPFVDADDFHSVENKEKMKTGIPLTEEDRIPWLEKLRDEVSKYISRGELVVLACSALQRRYRDILVTAERSDAVQDKIPPNNYLDLNMISEYSNEKQHVKKVYFVYLKGSECLLASRLAARHQEGKHFMPPTLLKSQIDLLELTEDEERVISLDASLSPQDIVGRVKNQMLLMF